VSVLFEQLVTLCPHYLPLALPSLAAQLDNPIDWVRGEAVSVLGIIGSEAALALVRSRLDDASPQVAEIAHDILGLPFHG
jgi:HEAT repeat protein